MSSTRGSGRITSVLAEDINSCGLCILYMLCATRCWNAKTAWPIGLGVVLWCLVSPQKSRTFAPPLLCSSVGRVFGLELMALRSVRVYVPSSATCRGETCGVSHKNGCLISKKKHMEQTCGPLQLRLQQEHAWVFAKAAVAH